MAKKNEEVLKDALSTMEKTESEIIDLIEQMEALIAKLYEIMIHYEHFSKLLEFDKTIEELEKIGSSNSHELSIENNKESCHEVDSLLTKADRLLAEIKHAVFF